MNNLLSVNGHDDESRLSTQGTATSLDPERLSHDNASRDFHNNLLELPSAWQTPNRYSVASFNQHLDEINTNEGSLYRRVRNPPPPDSEITNLGSEGYPRTPIPRPDEGTSHPSNEPLPVGSSLPPQDLDSNAHLNSPSSITTIRPQPTIGFPQSPPADLAVPQPTLPSTVTPPVHHPDPTPTQPQSSSSRKAQNRHHRRFLRWIKKKFREQLPWSTDNPHSQTEADRALQRVNSQGFSSRFGGQDRYPQSSEE